MPGILNNLRGAKINQTLAGIPSETLLIIGTAVDGPINEPVRIRDAEHAERVFGPAKYTGSYLDPGTDTANGKRNFASIPLAISRAVANGASDIMACRMSGTYASANSAFSSSLDIRSVYPGYIYNQIEVVSATGASNHTLTINQPKSKGGSVVFTFANTTTLEEVIDQINNSSSNQTIVIDYSAWPSTLTNLVTSLGAATVTLSGGTNGTTGPTEAFYNDPAGLAALLAGASTGTFKSIIDRGDRFDVVVLTGIYFDDEAVEDDATKTIGADFARFLTIVSQKAKPCRGFIGCRPTGFRDTADVRAYVNNSLLGTTTGYFNSGLKWIKPGYFLQQGFKLTYAGQTVDMGGRLYVIAGPDVIVQHADIGRYQDCWHVEVAARSTTVPPERSLAGIKLKGILSYVNEIPGDLVELLASGVGYNRTTNTVGGGAYLVLTRDTLDPDGAREIYADVTASARDDQFSRGQITHLANSILADLNTVLKPYIGGSSAPAIQAAMRADIRNVLQGYTESNGLVGGEGTGYRYNLKVLGAEQELGVITVDIDIFPARAIEWIKINMMVNN